jgi:AcrR family transcriptional regulator
VSHDNPVTESYERRDQKNRTREAILAGARALIERGETVTVTAAAAQSGVSKATAYRYFSDPKVLAAESGLAVTVSPYEEVIAGADTTKAKVLAISLYFIDLAIGNEAAFRHFLARNLDAWQASGTARPPSRGARRVLFFEKALEDERSRLTPARFDALVRALSAATGAEAMIALFDVSHTSPENARATVVEVAESLVDRFLGTQQQS